MQLTVKSQIYPWLCKQGNQHPPKVQSRHLLVPVIADKEGYYWEFIKLNNFLKHKDHKKVIFYELIIRARNEALST